MARIPDADNTPAHIHLVFSGKDENAPYTHYLATVIMTWDNYSEHQTLTLQDNRPPGVLVIKQWEYCAAEAFCALHNSVMPEYCMLSTFCRIAPSSEADYLLAMRGDREIIEAAV